MSRDLAQASIEYGEAAEALREVLQRRLLRVALRGEGIAKENATTRPRVRAGVLRRSIQGAAERIPDGAQVVLTAGGGSPAEAYASAQERGAEIVPRRGRFLAIPVGPALTPSGVPRVRSPRGLDLRFVPIRGGAMGLLVKDVPAGRRGQVRGETWFLLLRRVRVPETRFLGRAVDALRPIAQDELQDLLGDAVGGSNG